MPSSLLSPTQRYAAGALFGLALHQAHIHQFCPLGLHFVLDDVDDLTSDRTSSSTDGSGSTSDPVSQQPELWVNEHAGLLRPVFKVLEIESTAWNGLEQTAGNTPAKHHVGAFLRLLCEGEDSSKTDQPKIDQEIALTKSIDAMAASMEMNFSESKLEKQREYENERRKKYAIPESLASSTEKSIVETLKEERTCAASEKDVSYDSACIIEEEHVEEEKMLSYEKKLIVLYELISACLANVPEECKSSKQRRGYDARHRVALHLLSTWLDIKFVKVEAIETMIACSAMALLQQEEAKNEETKTKGSTWKKWKRGVIIGAAAVTGGTLLAITGGLAAPAIAAGFGALAPTLGTIIPVIGASGFAAVASAAGSVVGSVAIAASFGAAGAGLSGTKMARRTGSVDEFEFKEIGENHKQGRLAVAILVSGFVFDQADFIMPWEGLNDNLERYALQWESENLIAVSTAIQDWLTSSLALQLMKQGAMMTVLSTLLAALAWPATLLAATDFIDSKWSIAIDRSDKAGKLLAEVLMKGLQGNRPVTLVGYSLGARVIFKCLQYLAETEQTANIVEKVVAGRFVNVFSSNDWILGVAFRASLLAKGLAGIQAVNVPGIENVNATHIIEGHSSYLWATHQIMEELELESYFPVFRSFSATRSNRTSG
ncbi:hypothetical protein V2J09_009407 [Rumex salicifolius]